MKKNKYNFVHFLVGDECNRIAKLDINPKLNSEIRVYILFSEIERHFKITPQKLKKVKRKGFTLVE